MQRSQKSSSSTKKRLRIFAGPNGSGKTTVAEHLIKEDYFKTSIFVNADKVEEQIREQGYFDFREFIENISPEAFYSYIREGTTVKRGIIKADNLVKNISFLNGKLYYSQKINSYIAADICAFFRNLLLESGKSFIMETVFSHSSKLKLMKKAQNLGYLVYFYFISTDAPEVNINRVKIRTHKGGHNVPENKIISRYHNSLELLKDALKISYRAYLWDNSNQKAELFCEIKEGKATINNTSTVPNWFIRNVLEKNHKNI